MGTSSRPRRRQPWRRVALICLPLGPLMGMFGPAWASDASIVPGSGSAQLGLPIPAGESWTLVQGPHNTAGGLATPLSSLDLAGGSGHVVAAADGVVQPISAATCANPDPAAGLVVLDHGNGWHTSYYHLRDVQVLVGQSVRRGQWLGDTGTALPCGGSAVGDHTHFGVAYYTTGEFSFGRNMVDIRGMDIGGWTVWGTTYSGCLINDRTLVRVCSGQQGVVSTGISG